MKPALLIILLLFARTEFYSQTVHSMNSITGVTIDNINNLDEIVTSLKELPVKPTVRIVFDPAKPVSYYKHAVRRIHRTAFIMGELFDSYFMKDLSVEQYEKLTLKYVESYGSKIDIWEIGNESNGEWLGDIQSVTEKLSSAFRIVRAYSKPTALTLYYNKDCFAKPENEMFRWISENLSQNMKDSLNYVLISYYEDDCNQLQPDWQSVFDSLHVLFPNSMLGIGECGTKINEKKEDYMKQYYSMSIDTQNFVGGYFWWFYAEDCVPVSKPLWNTLKEILEKRN